MWFRGNGLILALVLTLSACVLPGKHAPEPPAENPITGAAIATTTLDAPGEAPGAAPQATPPAAAKAPAAPQPETPKPATPQPAAQPTASPKPAAVQPPATQTPEKPLTPEALACGKKGGIWAEAGNSGGMACVTRTQDAGKSCDRQSDCDGLCLSRSRTCAPVKPLFGCNDILEDDGREVTLCID